jgi:hypothetical protein
MYNRRIFYASEAPVWITPEGYLGELLQDGTPIDEISLSATELNGDSLTYAAESSLPNGLSLSSSGVLSGTLTGYTSFETVSFDVSVTDSEGEKSLRTFNVSISIAYQIQYLVVAGGGGGGGNFDGLAGGGGGAGGYLEGSLGVPLDSLRTITVGNGGSGTASGTGGRGGDSAFGDIVATGGGGGGGGYGNASSGGSGGGGSGYNSKPGAAGISGQGFSGGNGSNTASVRLGGGGGGASEPGENGVTSVLDSGTGGAGKLSSITGSSIRRGGGGSAGMSGTTGTSNPGGAGGGGNGGSNDVAPTSGTPNTGGGGGGEGASAFSSGAGGSGIVILRMPTVNYSGITTGSPSVSTNGSDTILTYTGSGTYTT